MTFTVLTLGCKVNQYESQVMHEALLSAGHTPVALTDRPELCVINTCTVTSVSDGKAMKLLRRTRRENPACVIVLTGCMPQAFPERRDKFSEADIVLGNKCRGELLPAIEKFLQTGRPVFQIEPHQNDTSFESMSVQAFHERTRAFVKIEDGCNRFCSYCIIPYARGRVRSKPLLELTKELTQIACRGYREVVLVGINLSAFGQEWGLGLADAIEAACAVDGIERVRLGSLEPERMDEAMIARLAKQEKLCPQFHLSLQSGSAETLKRMNRHYTPEQYRTIVQNLRAAFQNAAITTDIMVGFPGETQEEFAQSMAFAQGIGFAKTHVFSYSRRPGTRADKEPNQISAEVKEQRSKEMIALTNRSRLAFLYAQIGLTEEVLFETKRSGGFCEGYTRNYTPVILKTQDDLCGQTHMVRITGAEQDKCACELIR